MTLQKTSTPSRREFLRSGAAALAVLWAAPASAQRGGASAAPLKIGIIGSGA